MGWRKDGGRDRGRVAPIRAARLALLIVPLLLSALPVGAFSPAPASHSGAAPVVTVAASPPQPMPTETVAVQNQTIGNLSSFWGVGVSPSVSLDNATNETQPTLVNWYVWPSGDIADDYNMTNGTVWSNGYPTQEATNEAQFVAWCKSISCHAILSVPGEIDSPSTGAYELAYTEKVLNFYPAFWEVGNEPYGWLHFGKNWSSWNYTDDFTVNASGYAQVVHAYIAAMHAVDPHASFLGLPGVGAGGSPDGPWINATVALNGPNLSAIAIHDYPGEAGPQGGTLVQFFGSLTNKNSNMVTRITTDEMEVHAACPTCGIQFLVDEFGAGTGVLGSWQPFMRTYPEIPYVTAELLMMSESNVSNADLFALRLAYNGSLFTAKGLPFPLDSLYTQILPHYDPLPLATTVTGSVTGVFAGVSESPRSNSLTLLAVNTNTAQAVQLNVSGAVFPREGTYSAWRANNSTTSPNGTFSHSSGFESTPSWVLPPLGVLLVSVCRSNASLGSGGFYPLTFCGSGLPSGTPWSVTVGSSTTYSTGGTIVFSEPNGTYSYSIGTIPGWRVQNTSGSVTVDGAPSSIQVPWAAVTYSVTFTESGLPNGTVWSVTLGGTQYVSNSSNLTAYEPNGTYFFALGTVSGWTTFPTHGLVFVYVTPVQVFVHWTQVTYPVLFYETGLPPGTNWSVNLSGSVEYAMTTTLGFQEPNGTYTFTVGSVPGYTPDALSGSVSVQGAFAYVPLSWAANASVYPIQFNETNLPGGTTWNVSLDGTVQRGNGTEFTFYEPDGTYAYVLGEAAGWAPPSYVGSVRVNGASVFEDVSYTQLTYNVTFTETGLPYPRPSGNNWSVTVNGVTLTSPNPKLYTLEPNGTFSYRVGAEPGYSTTWQSWVTVHGSSVSVAVNFTPYSSTVTFTTSGLSTGTGWKLNVSGRESQKCYVGGEPCEEFLPNGTYEYSGSTLGSGWGVYPLYANFTVTGLPLPITIDFVREYLVTFTESGLPAATNWTVDLGGVPLRSNGPTIGFSVPNGTYAFSLGLVPGRIPSPARGQVSVSGAPVGMAISFGIATWSVGFTESGLPSGTSWSVTLNQSTNSSILGTISFAVPNGTYSYLIQPVAGYRPTPENGSIVVNGTTVSLGISFVPFEARYPVTFTESGLASGTNWSVLLNGSMNYSTGTNVSFLEPNGTYAYQIGNLSGFTASPTNGTVVVAGTGASVTVTWSKIPPNFAINFTETGLPSGTNWSVTIGAVTHFSDGGTTVQFQELNASYAYQIGPVAGYHPSPTNGSVVVSGAPAGVAIQWSQVTYTVNLSEGGLPSGLTWQVTVCGATEALTTNGATDNLAWTGFANGTCDYTITGISGWHEGTLPYNGSFIVNGGTGPINGTGVGYAVTLAYTQVTYAVTLSERGLPSGLTWQVTVCGVTESLTTNGHKDNLTGTGFANGTCDYNLTDTSGWHQETLPYNGSISVNGGTGPINGTGVGYVLTFVYTQVFYTVTFSESGLRSGLSWQVTICDKVKSLTTGGGENTLTRLGIANGTCDYNITDISGWHEGTLPYNGSFSVNGGTGPINGTGVGYAVTLAYAHVTYTVTLSESGLPSGLPWQVTVNGVSNSLTTNGGTDSLTWTGLANGTYDYGITGISGWHEGTLPYNGSIRVKGGTAPIDGTGVGFVLTFVYAQVTYTVTFSETGILQSGLTWQVTVCGVTESLTTNGHKDNLTWAGVANGTCDYNITGTSGWFQGTLPYNGSIGVNGGTGPVDGTGIGYATTVAYSQVPYNLTFSESGLPSGLTWEVTVNNEPKSLITNGNTDFLVFQEANGTLDYTISGNLGWHQATLAYSGVVVVSGASVTEPTLVYQRVTYDVTFIETGLPNGTLWSVTVGGKIANSTTDQIGFVLANGTVLWNVTALSGYTINHLIGTVIVEGANQSVMILFTARLSTYVLTFTEKGLSSGTNWSVSIGTSTHYSNGGPTVTFKESNGTVSYTIGPVHGYSVDTATGSVTLAGASIGVAVTFSSTGSPTPASTHLSALDWVYIAIVAALVVTVSVLALRTRKPGGPTTARSAKVPPQVAPPSATSTPAPSAETPTGASP